MAPLDDFEVAVFLTEVSSRHSILRKEKRVKSEKVRLGTGRLTGTGTRDVPVEIGDGGGADLIREESQEEDINLNDIPAEGDDEDGDSAPLSEGSQQSLFMSDGSGNENVPRNKTRSQRKDIQPNPKDIGGDMKKPALNTSYDGFSIYGRILCLVIKRRGMAKGKEPTGAGQAMMEDWIASTQMGDGQMMDD